MCNQLYRTRPDEILVAEAHLLAPMELEHRPREAQLAGSCLWLRSTCYATGGLGAATVHVEFSRPQSSLVLSLKRKYNQSCSLALQRVQLFPPEQTATALAKGKPFHTPNSTSLMCNRVSKPNHIAASWRLRRILTFAVPRPLCCFLHDESRAAHIRGPAKKNID